MLLFQGHNVLPGAKLSGIKQYTDLSMYLIHKLILLEQAGLLKDFKKSLSKCPQKSRPTVLCLAVWSPLQEMKMLSNL